MPFTEYCCRNGGSNLNAGTRLGDSTEPGVAAAFTYASGSWVQGTGVFTVASGNPLTDGVAVGDFASVYPDGNTVTPFVGRVTARDATTITVSLTAKSGTAPTNGTNTRSLRIGGAWQGPNGASGFPFNFVQSTMTAVAGLPPRVNLKNAATFSVTAATSHSENGPVQFEAYTAAYGDGGKAIVDGGSSGASYVLHTLNSSRVVYKNIIWSGNGATGSTDLVVSNAMSEWIGCVFRNGRGSGLFHSSSNICNLIQCESYVNNASGSGSKGGFAANNGTVYALNCIARLNGGTSGSAGFFFQSVNAVLDGSISSQNTGSGVFVDGRLIANRCDFYFNSNHGAWAAGNGGGAYSHLASCNFVRNGGFGVNHNASGGNLMEVNRCGFGSGTMANVSGNISGNVTEFGSVVYTANAAPWVDPVNGDFRIALTAARGAGDGRFTQTQSGQAGTIGYPDIGAAQTQGPTLPPTTHVIQGQTYGYAYGNNGLIGTYFPNYPVEGDVRTGTAYGDALTQQFVGNLVVIPPTAPLLSINPSGTVATVTGSTAGSTNTLYVTPAFGLPGSYTWSAAGSRSGNGTINFTLTNGFYWGVINSGLGGQVSTSNLVFFQVGTLRQTLTHTPAEIIRKAIVDLGYGTMPSAGQAWPASVFTEAASPDNFITVYNTTGRLLARIQQTGEWEGSKAVMVRVRGQTPALASQKVEAIAAAFDQVFTLRSVTIAGRTYLVHVVSRTGDPIDNGKEPGGSRWIYTLNALVTIEELT